MRRQVSKVRAAGRATIGLAKSAVSSTQDSLLSIMGFERRGHVVGAPPGLGLVDEVEHQEAATVRAFHYSEHELKELKDCSAAEALALRAPGSVTWIDVVGVRDPEVICEIGAALDLHPLALEDVQHINQRTKLEEYPEFDFIVMKSPGQTMNSRSEQISMFLCEGVVVTFQEVQGDAFEPVRDRLRLAKGQIRRRGADYLVYALVDAIVDALYPVMEYFGERLETLEAEVLERPVPALLGELHTVRRQLLALRKATWPLAETVSALGREANTHITPSTRTYLRDTQDHVAHVSEMVGTFREVADGLVDLYMSSVSNRMNEVMSLLTVITTIFVPLSFLTGLYGMNFDTSKPGNMPELSWPYAYPIALSGMFIIAVGLLIFFRSRGWLRWGG